MTKSSPHEQCVPRTVGDLAPFSGAGAGADAAPAAALGASVALQGLRALRAAGADVVFGLPGVHNLAFWRAKGAGGLPRIVTVRHEQTAVYAADGWARASGHLGAALVTTGPGAANCLGSFGEAARSRSPVVLIASEVPEHLVARGIANALHQSSDQAGMFVSLAKAVYRPRSAAQAVQAIGQAIACALSPPRGPVYLDIPADVLASSAGPVVVPEPSGIPLDQGGIDQAIQVISTARSVAIWAGGGAVDAEASGAIDQLARALHAPVFTTFASRGLVGCGHPCIVGLPPHEPEVGELLASAEVLLALGSDFDAMMTKNRTLRLPPKILHVNCDPRPEALGYPGVTGISADARSAALSFAEALAPRKSGLSDSLVELHRETWSRLRADPRTEPATRFVATIQRCANPSCANPPCANPPCATGKSAGEYAIVVNDMAIPGYWLASYLMAQRPRTIQYPVGWGTLGYALPASIGAALGGGAPVLAVCGDAGVMFGLGELATIAEHGLEVTLLVVDDGGYGMLRFDQRDASGAEAGMDLRGPDFVALARSFGIEASRVDEVGAPLRAELDAALSSGEPRVVVCKASLYPPATTSPRWQE